MLASVRIFGSLFALLTCGFVMFSPAAGHCAFESADPGAITGSKKLPLRLQIKSNITRVCHCQWTILWPLLAHTGAEAHCANSGGGLRHPAWIQRVKVLDSFARSLRLLSVWMRSGFERSIWQGRCWTPRVRRQWHHGLLTLRPECWNGDLLTIAVQHSFREMIWQQFPKRRQKCVWVDSCFCFC
jgi:hypothetical protein